MNIGGWVLPFTQPQPVPWFPISRVVPKPTHFLAIALSLRLSRPSSHSRLCSSYQDVWNIRAFRFPEFDLVKWLKDAFSTTSSLFLFNGNQGKDTSVGSGSSSSDRSNQTPYRRQWTNVLLAANVLLFIAQIATQGKMMLWGAKINSLISEGQLWRLVTSSFLHANIGHLMVNCYSLNSVGPAVETFSGPQRFFAIYFTSAVASTVMSYWLSKAPAVGASGAIFGLVGSVAVFVMRHRGMVGRGSEDLQHIAHVIIINMVIGGLSRGIDNWGHLGGLFGGVAMSWLLGPAWQYESVTRDGRKIFSDRAPISRLLNYKKPPWLR